jgi:hypothetical protein
MSGGGKIESITILNAFKSIEGIIRSSKRQYIYICEDQLLFMIFINFELSMFWLSY